MLRTAAIALLFLAVAVVGPAAAHATTYSIGYVANPVPIVRVFGSNFGFEPGLGGSGFPDHPHATTASISVSDRVGGGIPALVCQDVNWDFVCDATPGSVDVLRCFVGSTTGFPVQASTGGARKPLTVLVALEGYRLEVCNVNGHATTGTISLSYA